MKARPAWRDAEHRAQHLRREARAAHAEQHDVGEPVAPDGLGERLRGGRAIPPSAPASSASRGGWRSSAAPPDRRSRPTDRGATSPRPRVRPRRRASRTISASGPGESSKGVLEASAPGGRVERRPAREQVVRAVHDGRILQWTVHRLDSRQQTSSAWATAFERAASTPIVNAADDGGDASANGQTRSTTNRSARPIRAPCSRRCARGVTIRVTRRTAPFADRTSSELVDRELDECQSASPSSRARVMVRRRGLRAGRAGGGSQGTTATC